MTIHGKTIAEIAADFGYAEHQIRHAIDRIGDLTPCKFGTVLLFDGRDERMILKRLRLTARPRKSKMRSKHDATPG